MANLCYLSDADVKGSGYQGIGMALCNGLASKGHVIKYGGINYHGEEHWFPFSIIPANTFPELEGIWNNLNYVWNPDLVIVAFDIPIQHRLVQSLTKQFKKPYIGIMPLESDPLCVPWAMPLMAMNRIFFISEFGAREARKVGLPAKHLQMGLDTQSWRRPTPEEKKAVRLSMLGIEDDSTFVVLTVADNQERKNLSAAMQIMSEFKEKVTDNFKYVLVTREGINVGWELTDLSRTQKISKQFVKFERGIPFRVLWSLFAASDCFLLTSKGEGYGQTIPEAMSVGVPCVGNRTGAIIEHLENERGFLIQPAFVHIDPYGNSNRYYADIHDGAAQVEKVWQLTQNGEIEIIKQRGREYVESRSWQTAIEELDKAINEVMDEQAKIQTGATIGKEWAGNSGFGAFPVSNPIEEPEPKKDWNAS